MKKLLPHTEKKTNKRKMNKEYEYSSERRKYKLFNIKKKKKSSTLLIVRKMLRWSNHKKFVNTVF